MPTYEVEPELPITFDISPARAYGRRAGFYELKNGDGAPEKEREVIDMAIQIVHGERRGGYKELTDNMLGDEHVILEEKGKYDGKTILTHVVVDIVGQTPDVIVTEENLTNRRQVYSEVVTLGENNAVAVGQRFLGHDASGKEVLKFEARRIVIRMNGGINVDVSQQARPRTPAGVA